MPTITVTRPAGYPFHVGDGYEFERDGQHFNGVVRDIMPADARHVDITLEMSTGEYRRVLAALNG
jgi:hypothetical protein